MIFLRRPLVGRKITGWRVDDESSGCFGVAELLGPLQIVVHHGDDLGNGTKDSTFGSQFSLSSAFASASPFKFVSAAFFEPAWATGTGFG